MPEYRLSYQRVLDANGNPLAGAKLYSYEAGTTTPKATYTSYLLSTPNANPVVADAGGLFGAIWQALSGRYKFVLKDANDVTLWTDDFVEDAGADILTARGDVLTRDATGYKRLGLGTNGQALTSNGADLVWSTIPSLSAANTWTGSNTFQLSDDSASAGPTLDLFRISASPAGFDRLGALQFRGRNSAAESIDYSQIIGEIADPTDGSEDGGIVFQTMGAGSAANRFRMRLGLFADGTNDQGAGTINAVEYYKNNAPLSAGPAAWALFTPAGTLTANHNVASITDNGAGDFTVNFDVALASANYAAIATCHSANANADGAIAIVTSRTASTVRIKTFNNVDSAAVDPGTAVMVAVFI